MMGIEIILFPGSFKPMHRGHAHALNEAMALYPQATARILVSEKPREGWTAADAVATINHFFPGDEVEYVVVGNPVKMAIDHARGNANAVLVTSAKDADQRFKSVASEQVFVATTLQVAEDKPMSSSGIRKVFSGVMEYLRAIAEPPLGG